MKRFRTLLAALAIVLALAAGFGLASAYFTTYARASGGYTIELGERTEIYERFSQWTKHVAVTSEEGSKPVFVRVKAFWGETYDVSYDGGEHWTEGEDGFWYCGEILYAEGETPELDIHINNVPTDVESGDSFNVVVVYETTPVLYDAEGAPYADWNITLDTGTTGGAEE